MLHKSTASHLTGQT